MHGDKAKMQYYRFDTVLVLTYTVCMWDYPMWCQYLHKCLESPTNVITIYVSNSHRVLGSINVHNHIQIDS